MLDSWAKRCTANTKFDVFQHTHTWTHRQHGNSVFITICTHTQTEITQVSFVITTLWLSMSFPLKRFSSIHWPSPLPHSPSAVMKYVFTFITFGPRINTQNQSTVFLCQTQYLSVLLLDYSLFSTHNRFLISFCVEAKAESKVIKVNLSQAQNLCLF